MNCTKTGIASLVTLGSVYGCSTSNPKENPKEKYNVLFITVDDMRDYVGYLGGYGGKVHTPNMDRLASMGVAFTNAHTSVTVSCPSRNAMLTGKRPSTTGLYNNDQWWKAALPELVPMPQYFRNNGYYTAGAGKIFHHTPGNNPPCSWDEYQAQVFDDPWVFAEWSPEKYWLNYGYRTPKVPFPNWKPLNGIPTLGAEMDWGAIPGKKDGDYGDVQIVNFARKFLAQKHEKPFFLALGTFRPHIPWHVPQKYFDMYPLDSIVLPIIKEDDLNDIPEAGKKLALDNNDYNLIKDAGKYKEAIQAYLACITFADTQLGDILEALKKSDYNDNTIIVFWSDHGWHFGTKQHWHKQTLWEECTRIPFIIKVPGITKPNSVCDKPVDMVNVFPTLITLCGLPKMDGLDGHDMTPLLKNPGSEWNYPAITEIKVGHVAIRSQNWRYIHYNDGTEELYDRINDPNEWTNLAGDVKYNNIIEMHRKWIPASFAKPVPGKASYYFDPCTYTFMNRETGAFVDGKEQVYTDDDGLIH
ncbi:MAG: sulfatase [Bacteroidia bacterium]|nr:sulfatase [Bacteroidia bacterium]